MSDESPRRVGAPSELADAEEMPAWVIGAVMVLVGVPLYVIKELPTLPLDALVFAHEKAGWLGALLTVVVMAALGAALCWGLLSLL